MLLPWKWVCSRASILPVVMLLSLVCLGCGGGSVTEPHNPEKHAEFEEGDPTFRVPGGSPKAILEFAKQLLKRTNKLTDPAALRDDAIKTQKALIQAGDRILSQKADDATLRDAVGIKLVATIKLAMLQMDDDAIFESNAKEAIAVVSQLRQDARKAVAETADNYWIPAQALSVNSLSSDDRAALANEAFDRINNQFTQQEFGATYFLVERFIKVGDFDQASSLLERLAQAVSKKEQKELRSMVSQLKVRARLLRLGGKPIEIDGRLSDGSQLDWESYRGKVVLIDFWATWCTPCVAELKNVKANYEKFHSKGFDVIGINIDHDPNRLAEFLKTRPLPWVQVLDQEESEAGEYHPSNQRRFGISSIPQAILVDANGIVVSVDARGEELQRLLEKMLDSKE